MKLQINVERFEHLIGVWEDMESGNKANDYGEQPLAYSARDTAATVIGHLSPERRL